MKVEASTSTPTLQHAPTSLTPDHLPIALGGGTWRTDPLQARRPHVELHVPWVQETQRFAASTVSRRTSVVTSSHLTRVVDTRVVDELLEHSPAGYVRRPNVPPESPTLGLSHLQSAALLATSRDAANPCDSAMVRLLGLLGLRIFEACGLDITDLGEEDGHRVLRVVGEGHEIVLVPLAPAAGRAVARAVSDRTTGALLLNTRGAGWAATPTSSPPQASGTRPDFTLPTTSRRLARGKRREVAEVSGLQHHRPATSRQRCRTPTIRWCLSGTSRSSPSPPS